MGDGPTVEVGCGVDVGAGPLVLKTSCAEAEVVGVSDEDAVMVAEPSVDPVGTVLA